MSNIMLKLLSMLWRSEVNLFIYSWLAFDYSTFDRNKFTVVPIFFETIRRAKDNGGFDGFSQGTDHVSQITEH